ncbi:MAG: MoaD/ThiS family protein [Kiloniellales bacterium]|nr:MoaD/ThiS family protein [Kiloniellales bacterium]
MRITVRTGGVLGQYLPAGGEKNRASLDIEAGTTPRDVMARLGFPAERTYLVTLNGTAIPKAERETRALAEDDELAILPPLKGG